MLTMEVPYVPAQETPIVLVQADVTVASAPQPDYILNLCKETESTGDPRSAMRAVDPAGMLKIFIQMRENRQVEVDLTEIKNVTMLQGTQHGKIFAWVDYEELTSYHYDPEPDYIGNDSAVFQAEFEGKIYKIVVELHVFEGPATPGDFGASTCPEPQLIKVTKPANPSSGATGTGAGYDLASVSVTFAELEGAAIGQTAGSTITLDTTAAGHNWYIDTTPADNTTRRLRLAGRGALG